MRLSPRFRRALTYAARLHARQPRKGTAIPYIAHPLGVASIALEHGATEDEAIAALLHDAVEDARAPGRVRKEIRRRFGAAVAHIVEGCTDSEGPEKPEWRPRKECYLAHLRHACAPVRLVAASDKLHNARAILRDYRGLGEALWPRFSGGREGTLWYYRALVQTFREGLCHEGRERQCVEELDRVVSEIEALAAGATPPRG